MIPAPMRNQMPDGRVHLGGMSGKHDHASSAPTSISRRIAVASVFAVAVALILFAGVIGEAPSRDVTFAGDLRLGGRLESLSLPQLDGTGTLEYASFSDRPLVINFFASWCPNCISEMPQFEKVHRELGERVGFLGVSQRDAVSASVELVRKTGVTYPTGIDRTGSFFDALGGIGMPTTVFVLPGGTIAETWTGAMDAELLTDLIAEHFGR